MLIVAEHDFTSTPTDYESGGLWGSWAVTGRKVTGFSDGIGQGDRHRTYADPGGGVIPTRVAVS